MDETLRQSSGPGGHAQEPKKSATATESGGGTGSAPPNGPYYINLPGSGYVEVEVPADRLKWEEKSAKETGDISSIRNIAVKGQTGLVCQITQQVFNGTGAMLSEKWTRKLKGMYG